MRDSDGNIPSLFAAKRPALLYAIWLCLGILCSSWFVIPARPVFSLTIILAISSAIFSRTKAGKVLLFSAVFLFGIAILQNNHAIPADHIAHRADTKEGRVLLKGIIVSPPVMAVTRYRSERISFILKVQSVKGAGDWERSEGFLATDVYSDPGRAGPFAGKETFFAGDEIILEGDIAKPSSLRNPGIFDYTRFLARRKIYAVFKVRPKYYRQKLGAGKAHPFVMTAYRLRQRIIRTIEEYFPSPYRGFLKALLVGDREDLDTVMNDDFIKTGTVHILSVSGLHVGLIAAFFLWTFWLVRIPRKVALVAVSAIMILYAYVAGLNPPIVRATIMFCIFALGVLIDREADILNSLSAAAFLILVGNPDTLFDAGFQLSFLSIASIAVFTPQTDRLLHLDGKGPRVPRIRAVTYAAGKSVSVSLAAWIGVWPVIASYFNIASPVSVIANLVAIPAVFVIMVWSLVFLAAALFSATLASILAAALMVCMKAFFVINTALTHIPYAFIRVAAPSVVLGILYYGVLALWCGPTEILVGNITIRRKMFFAAIAAIACGFAFTQVFDPAQKLLRITFFDVGKGDAALIRFPRGGTLLIDGGEGEETGYDIGKNVIAPYLWNHGIKKIDAVMVTHFHSDHLGGLLYLLDNFRVGRVIDGGVAAPIQDPLYGAYEMTLKRRGIRRTEVCADDEITRFGNVRLTVLNPQREEAGSDQNDTSIVMKLTYKNTRVLFAGDITDAGMARVNRYGPLLSSDILKVPHHGGRFRDEKTAKEFLNNVAPTHCVVSARTERRKSRSAQSVRRLLNALPCKVYATEEDGAVTAYSDGESWRVEPSVRNN